MESPQKQVTLDTRHRTKQTKHNRNTER